MVDQYNSQYSSKSKTHKIDEEMFYDIEVEDLTDIEIIEDDITEAIGKMKMNSAAGPDGILTYLWMASGVSP